MPNKMLFSNARKATQLIESLENYSVMDNTVIKDPELKGGETLWINDDQYFWRDVLASPDKYWNRKIEIYEWVISDWVARVPGLYWHQEAEGLRDVPESLVEIRSKNYVQYQPSGKSRKVMGGIGTFLLPPADDGKQIMSITNSHNASLGIPMLVYPEVIAYHKLVQGDQVSVRGAVWRKMSQEWVNRFPERKGIPRGYLVVDHPDQLIKHGVNAPIVFQPFSIMEYDEGHARLFDYTYFSIDSYEPGYRDLLRYFFEKYRTENGRNGRYLIAADMNEPLFDAAYNNPAELLRNEVGGKAQLALLAERIRGAFLYKQESLESIIQKISAWYTGTNEVQALAISIDISPGLLEAAPPIKMAMQLVAICSERNKLVELIDQILYDHPQINNT